MPVFRDTQHLYHVLGALFEDKLLYAATGPVQEQACLVPPGRADVKRAGGDVTVVAVGAMVGAALEAAESLSQEGIDVEGGI